MDSLVRVLPSTRGPVRIEGGRLWLSRISQMSFHSQIATADTERSWLGVDEGGYLVSQRLTTARDEYEALLL